MFVLTTALLHLIRPRGTRYKSCIFAVECLSSLCDRALDARPETFFTLRSVFVLL